MKNLIVGVVGLGDVGFEVAKEISKIQHIPDAKYCIEKIVLFSRKKDKAETTKKIIIGLKNPEIEVVAASNKEISTYMPNISIICASSDDAKKLVDRRKMGEVNMKIVEEISSKLPDDCLELIVTNHVLTLPQVIVSSLKRNPELTVGLAQIDSIRARIAIEEYLQQNGIRANPVDTSDVYMIGSHDDNEMVLAYSTAKINSIPLREIKSLENEILKIEEFATAFAHEQIALRKTTSELAAQAVVETLKAVLTEKSYVSAGILCNFDDEFFRLDPDYHKFKKPKNPLYMVIRTGFKDLRAGFFAGKDRNPDSGWFARQTEETKRRFYEIATKQAEYVERFAPQIRRVNFSIVKTSKAEKELELLVAINSFGKGTIYKLDTKSSEKYVVKEIEEPVKRIGLIDEKLYATTTNSVYFEDRKIILKGYKGGYGINSFLPWNGKFFATHHKEGLLRADDAIFYQIFKEPSRELTIFNKFPVFASRNKILTADNPNIFKTISRENIIALLHFKDDLYAVDYNAIYKLKGLGQDVFATEIKEQRNFHSAASFNKGIALLNEDGILVFDPEKEQSEFYQMPGFIAVAAKNDSLVAYNESMINSLEGRTIMALDDKNSEIAFVLVV